MQILVLGGTGLISREVVRQAVAAGHRVTVFNRGQREAEIPDGVRRITGDRFNYAAFETMMAPEHFDAVVDMIAYTEQDAASTLRAFQGRTGQIVFTSSIACYQRPFHRNPPIPEAGNEYVSDPTNAYGYNKGRMEQFLLTEMQKKTTPALTIIRPSLTFGRGGTNLGIFRQNYGLVKRIRDGKPVVLFGDGQTPMYFSFSPDVARGYLATLGNSQAYGQIYHLNSMEYSTWEDLYLSLGRVVGTTPRIVHIATDLLFAANPALNGHLYYDKQWMNLFDATKAERDIGFKAELSLEQGLRWMVEWFDVGHDQTINPEVIRFEDKLIECHERWSREISQ